MGLLEDALRDAFAAQVTAPPALDDVAGRAVARAARLRRHRAMAGTLAVVLGLALVGTGAVAVAHRLRPAGTGDPAVVAATPSTAIVPLAVDVLAGSQILARSGATITLGEFQDPQRAWRVPDGWLIETQEPQGRSAVWLLTGSAKSIQLAAGERVAVGATDNGQVLVSWSDKGRVSTGAVDGGQLKDRRDTGGTGALGPLAVVGNGVLLSSGGVYDMWFPHQGGYSKGPQSTDLVLGTGTGRIFGVSSAQRCFVQIDPVGLAVVRSRCGLGLTSALTVLPSPDGRWIAALTEGQVDVYSLTGLWTQPATPPITWKVRPGSAQWLADGTLAVAADSDVVQLHPDDPDRRESTPLPATAGTMVTLIPDLR